MSDQPIKMVALDIDGTLLNPGVAVDSMPDAAMTDAVHQLKDAGIVVVLASGRMYPGTASIAQHLGIHQPLICQQGASVHEADGRLRHGLNIDPQIALELMQYATDHQWPLAWFDSQTYLVTEHCQQAQFFADVSGIRMQIDPEPHLSGIRATGIDIISTAEDASRVHAEIESRYGAALSLLDFPSVTAVHNAAASKGNALHQLATELGITAQQVLAVGDSVNDVSMLQWAGHSASPQHSDHYAKAATKQLLPGEGVSGVVEKLRWAATQAG